MSAVEVGIFGWTYESWRGTNYPPKLMLKDSYIVSKENIMWFYKLILLLTLLAVWIPRESQAASHSSMDQVTHHATLIDFEESEEEDDEGEELAA